MCVIKLKWLFTKKYFYPATFTSLFPTLGCLNVDKIRKSAVILFYADTAFFTIVMMADTLKVIVTFHRCDLFVIRRVC